MRAHVLSVHRLVFIGLTAFLWGCAGSEIVPGPTNSPTRTTSAPAAPAVSGEWSGTVELSSVSPAGSCPAIYLKSHPELFAESASADLNVAATPARMEIRTAGGQQCSFSGISGSEGLTLSARHDTCYGYPLSVSAIHGIVDVCKVIDPAGDGPYWGDGTFVARGGRSDLDGHWIFAVFEPGDELYPETKFSIDLHVHLAHQGSGAQSGWGPL